MNNNQINVSKGICFIQIHHTDLEHTKRSHLLIKKLKDMKIFNEIVLAAAGIPENEVIIKFAEEMDVKYFLGNTKNIAKRMLEVIEKFNGDYLVRVLVNWFYVDSELIKQMIKYANSLDYYDYVYLPHDFDIKYGADIISKDGLMKLNDKLDVDQEVKKKFKFRPWYLMESDKLFQSHVFENVPTYSNEYFYKLRNELIDDVDVAWKYGINFEYEQYEKAKEYIDKNHSVLDISCGYGYGSNELAKKAKKVTGVDIEEKYIDFANKNVKTMRGNLEFIKIDEQRINFPDQSFDRITSIHTMEHVKNEEKFLNEIKRVLKKDGVFILEVPIRIKQPFIFNNDPLGHHTDSFAGHYREYTVDSFKKLVSKYFTISEIFGVNRGIYCPINEIRNAVMSILK